MYGSEGVNALDSLVAFVVFSVRYYVCHDGAASVCDDACLSVSVC